MKPLLNFIRNSLACALILSLGTPYAIAQNPKRHTETQTVKKKKSKSTDSSNNKKKQDNRPKREPEKSVPNAFLTVNGQTSNQTLRYDDEGGKKWVDVATNETSGFSFWGVPSWCSISGRTSNGFYLSCEPNTNSEERRDWMEVTTTSGKAVRIDIKQAASDAKAYVSNVTVLHDQNLADGKGMVVKFRLNVTGMKGKECRAVAYFCDAYSNKLYDSKHQNNDIYVASDDQICSRVDLKPQYDETQYQDLTISIPYSQLQLKGGDRTTLKFNINVWNRSVSPSANIAITEYYSTTFTPPSTVPANSYSATTTTNQPTTPTTPTTTTVTPTPTTSYSSVSSGGEYKHYRPESPRRPVGISFGYVRKQWVATHGSEKMTFGLWDNADYIQGIQAGLRIEPYAKFGLGVNTGVFYEFYYAKSDAMKAEGYDVYGELMEHAIYVPLHLCYRLRLGEFQIFAFGGVGADYGIANKLQLKFDGTNDVGYESSNTYETDDSPNWKRFNASYEFGGGLRYKSLQASFTMSQGFLDMSSTSNYVIKQNKPMMISLGIMF